MQRGSRSRPALRPWASAAVVLLVVGLAVRFALGGLAADITWMLLTIAAAIVFLVGYSRHQPDR